MAEEKEKALKERINDLEKEVETQRKAILALYRGDYPKLRELLKVKA